MCDPTMMAIMKVGGQAVGTMAKINEQNAASNRNSAAARAAAVGEYQSINSRYVEDQRGLIQAGLDMTLEGRAAEAVAYTSSVENGVQGTSVAEMILDNRAKRGRNTNRNEQEMASLRENVGIDLSNIDTKRQQRENSVPRTSFGVGDALKIGSTAVDAFS